MRQKPPKTPCKNGLAWLSKIFCKAYRRARDARTVRMWRGDVTGCRTSRMVRASTCNRTRKRMEPMSVYRDRDEEAIEPLLISAKRAAKLLCISVRYLYTLTETKAIASVRIGRKRLYRIEDIQRFVNDRSDGPSAALP